MVRLFHIGELNWSDDLARVREICEKTGLSLAPKDIQATANLVLGLGTSQEEDLNCYCCCRSHHLLLCNTATEQTLCSSSVTIAPISMTTGQYTEADRFLE